MGVGGISIMNTTINQMISLALVRIEESHFLGSDSDKISEARGRLALVLQKLSEPDASLDAGDAKGDSAPE